MELESLLDRIGLQPEMTGRLRKVGETLELAPLDPCLEGLLDPSTAGSAYAELAERIGEDPDGVKMLYCQLECARRDRERYERRGIPEEVYLATMGCFSRFIRETRRRTGRLAFDRGWWTWRQVSMTLFRLGSLEYERRERDGERVTALHIPSDADLSPEAVDASLCQAEKFFDRFFGGMGRLRCHSWLLSPALRPFLREDSHILAFQRRFEIEREDPVDREFVLWLFEAPEDTPPAGLSERTSLQRAVKTLLLSGGTVGSAYGTMRNDLRRSL